MIWNFNDTNSTNGERRSYTYSVCGEAALCNMTKKAESIAELLAAAAPWFGRKIILR
jgi:hypothetical protein